MKYQIVKNGLIRAGYKIDLKDLINQIDKMTSTKRFFVTLSGFDFMEVSIEHVSHIVTSYSRENDDIFVELKDLNTPNSMILQKLKDNGVEIFPIIVGIGDYKVGFFENKVKNFQLSRLQWLTKQDHWVW